MVLSLRHNTGVLTVIGQGCGSPVVVPDMGESQVQRHCAVVTVLLIKGPADRFGSGVLWLVRLDFSRQAESNPAR